MSTGPAFLCDLRSDTVTRPTDAMRRAMAEAEVGDDVFGDDPNVNALEREAADLLGREAALFVPSGTMGNQIALKFATRAGDEAIVEERSHMLLYEVGAAGMISGVQLRTCPSTRGVLDLAAVRRSIRDPRDLHQPRTSFLAIENTHNVGGGLPIPVEHLEELAGIAAEHDLHFHMDGARLFNAAISLGVEPAELARHPKSVMFCLSKGLGAPVGSLLVSDADVIRSCRRIRKALGGGMRQAGIVAAAGRIALSSQVGRLVEDHRRARRLGEAAATMPGITVDLDTVASNMVYLDVDESVGGAEALEARLLSRGVGAVALGPQTLRLVTHLDVDDAALDEGIRVLGEILHESLDSGGRSAEASGAVRGRGDSESATGGSEKR